MSSNNDNDGSYNPQYILESTPGLEHDINECKELLWWLKGYCHGLDPASQPNRSNGVLMKLKSLENIITLARMQADRERMEAANE